MKSISELMKDIPTSKEEVNYCDMLQKQADIYNASVGSLNELDCPICKNKGYIQKVKFIEMYQDYIPVMSTCKCMEKRNILRKAKESGLGEYLKMRFSDYETNDQWQVDFKRKAIDYCKADSNDWFVALGQSGSGKTMLSCIISNYLLLEKDKEVVYITWTDFISKLKRDMMGDNSNEVSDYLDSIKNIEVLFIDELLKKYNETDLKYIIEIINYRYTNDLKTIITSERLLSELLEIDEATFSRVVEKSNGYISNISKDIKKNYRLKDI